jgi:hypothetical protein
MKWLEAYFQNLRGGSVNLLCFTFVQDAGPLPSCNWVGWKGFDHGIRITWRTLKGVQSPITTVSNIWEGPSQSTLLNIAGSEIAQPMDRFMPLFTGSQKISHICKIDTDRGMVTNRASNRDTDTVRDTDRDTDRDMNMDMSHMTKDMDTDKDKDTGRDTDTDRDRNRERDRDRDWDTDTDRERDTDRGRDTNQLLSVGTGREP